MGTVKRYLTVDQLRDQLNETGWRVASIATAPPILLTLQALSVRYAVEIEDMTKIGEELIRRRGEREGVFERTADGFNAYLRYRIFTCVAGGGK